MNNLTKPAWIKYLALSKEDTVLSLEWVNFWTYAYATSLYDQFFITVKRIVGLQTETIVVPYKSVLPGFSSKAQ